MEIYPLLNKEHLIECDNKENIKFQKNLNWSYLLITKINNEATEIGEIPLSFYPIAKNIRFTSSYMTKNIFQNKKSIITNLARDKEIHYWENKLNRGKWYPWLWARGRINNDYTVKEGWNYYFKSFENNIIEENDEINDFIEKPDFKYITFFIYLACLKYTFNFNDEYIKMAKKNTDAMNWPASKKILAVQIRRGDTCTKTCSKFCRDIIDLSVYIENIDKLMKNNNFEYIYISTDSDEEIDKIKEARPEWKLLYLPLDRTKFFRMDDNASVHSNNFAKEQVLEDSCRLNPDSIPFIVDSALMDLYFISISQGYISTISSSEFSKLGWYLQITTQGRITPYINLNNKEIDLTTKNTLLLL